MISQDQGIKKGARLAVPAAWCALLLGAAVAADAVQYRVNGQVLQVPTTLAENVDKTEAQLTGPALPFVRVKVYDRDSGQLLGEADAGQTGGYTVRFDLPAAAPAPRVDCRVYLLVDGSTTLLPEAREGINAFPKSGSGGISTFQFALLKVRGDDIIDYDEGGPGSLYGDHAGVPGLGLVFTRVGKVEISEIKGQDLSLVPAMTGLADYTGSEARANELGVFAFKKAPFGGRLLMFGDFGLPSGGTCTVSGSQVDWYQMRIKRVNEPFATPLTYASDIPWQDPMSKRRTQLVVSAGPPPSVNASVTTELIGPHTGYLDNPGTAVVDRGASVGSLYRVNRNQTGGMVNVIYSYPDLRVNWVSGAADGLYELSPVYYRIKPNPGGDEKIVEEIPYSDCLNSGTVTGDADKVALHTLYIRVNNDPLKADFQHIYLRDTKGTPSESDDTFYSGGPSDVLSTVGAHDFNNEGLCDIMKLLGKYQVDVRFTARHDGGYLDYYSLVATSNDDAVTVGFVSPADSFTSHVSATDPSWFGTGTAADPNQPRIEFRGGFINPCVYDFDLHARSRLHNGYNHIQWRHRDKGYYVEPVP